MGKKLDAPELNCITEEDWETLCGQEGLMVVDVFARWAGPCIVMKPVVHKIKAKVSLNLKKIHSPVKLSIIKNMFQLQVSDEHDDIIQYCTACSDNIPQLQCFKNICTPVFIFMAEG